MSAGINISNYEEFLYSFVDGELTADEIMALEAFLDAQPHIREELELLMSTRIQPEEMAFPAKASLYRSAQATDQYESRLLSYIDNELNAAEVEDLQRFMTQHPALEKELALWQQTKVQPDLSIQFEHKQSLYRHNQTRTVRMRPVYWWATAAVVAGALFMLRNTFTADQPGNPAQLAKTSAPAAAPQPVITPAAPDATAENSLAAASPDAPVKAPAVSAAPAKETAKPEVTAPSKKESVQQHTLLAVHEKAAAPGADLSAIQQQTAPALIQQADMNMELTAGIRKVKENETIIAANTKPSIDIQAAAPLATPAPQEAPGELIMSVSGNGLESRVLGKLANTAKLFAKKRNHSK